MWSIVGRSLTCLYSGTRMCRVGSGLVVFFECGARYTPTVFWVGAVVGCLMRR